MATREKTVAFSFPMTTAAVADAVVTNLSQITLYIPEASPTFTSVFVDVGFQDSITATGGTINEHRVGLRLGAAAYTTFTETDDLTNTGENIAGVIGPVDFTSHFNTNWTGTSMTCDLQVYFDLNTGTTLDMNNVTAVVYITYTYDDSAATQIKTVHIPLESLTTTLPTTQTNFGTNQIPQLTGAGGMLPEASPVIRDYFFLIEGNESNNNGTTDFTLSAAIDGGAATTFMNQEAALGTDRYCRWIYKPSVPTTTAAHNFQLWASVARCNHVTVTLVVTYEFTLSGTTRFLNSIRLPVEVSSPLGNTASGNTSRFQRTISIVEDGTITLKQSAVFMAYNAAASITAHNWRVGGQSFRAYTPAANTVGGMFSVQQRIDSGAAQGAGITLARGFNTITIDGYATSASVFGTNVNGYILLNYESDLTGSPGQHNHTVQKVLRAWDAFLGTAFTVNAGFAIPEANYYLVSFGIILHLWNTNAANAIIFDAECAAGEGQGAGYYSIYADALVTDAELGYGPLYMGGRDKYKIFPQDVRPDRMDVETARDYRFFAAASVRGGALLMATYHSHTFTAAGNISGHNASLPTDLQLVRNSTGEVLQEATLSAGTTAFSFTVYDDTEDYYVSAYQDATHTGRSALAQGV